MFLTLLVLLVLVIGLLVTLVQAQLEKSRLKQSLRKYDTLIEKEEFERQLDSNIQLKKGELANLGHQQQSLNTQIENLQYKLRDLDAKAYLQSIEYYEPKYDFVSSEDYISRLTDIKSQQERMRKNNQAFICDTPWRLGESKKGEKEGEKMVKDLLKLVEFSFETQCNYLIKEVKYNNVESSKTKLSKTFNKINKFLNKIDCKISLDYLEIKLIELDLQYELDDKKQEEREREQELKKQNKEREAIEKVRQKAEEVEEREKLHQQQLYKLQQQIQQVEQAEVEKRKQLELQIQQLEQQLAEDKIDKEKAIYESKRVKWGYIYIISNIGSLGRDVYRICMTNRQKEDDYIRDMNPIVPFKFDVHFKIFSEDVLDTLEKLYQRFADKRVNLVNPRRDFFKISINEIEEAVQEIDRKTGVLTIYTSEIMPQASEYSQTLSARKKNQNFTSDNSYLGEDEIS